MITAIALMCTFGAVPECQAITKGAFFRTTEECEAELANALAYADSKGRYVAAYKCIVWGEPCVI